ncbi:DNA-3-methyladenine glycosylase I [Labilibacter sediminis]|nr:DNA-3-methyladenine glycosylase I [Labilibacter sediminis]
MENNNECGWSTSSQLMQEYHDSEWGVPIHDDQKLFEFLSLEGFQAGLSWSIILNKREHFRVAFDDFDWRVVAEYSSSKELELQQNEKIIRNKLKIKAAIGNAKAFCKIISEFGSFNSYIWQFVNHKPIVNQFNSLNEIPALTPIAESMSKDLKKRGFKFVGPTICYAFMQATGMVNDHVISCKRHKEVQNEYKETI